MVLPSCFKNPNTITSSGSDHQQKSLITCTYQIELCNNSRIQLTLTWSKTLTSHSLILHSPHLFSVSVSLSPPPFSLFRTRPGSKSVPLSNTQNPDSSNKLRLYWDFSKAEFPRVNSAEPDSSFYIALVCNGRVAFFVGDRRDELTRRVHESVIASRREHLFGRRSFSTTARFMKWKYEVEIECRSGTLKVKMDGKTKVVVKRLGWKFRGSERIIMVDGLEIDFSWDVLNWVSNNGGNGVFVFRVGEGGGACPEMLGLEKKLIRRCSSPAMVSPAPSSSSSVLQWAEETTDSPPSNFNSSSYCGGGNGAGFSLVLYAWRRD